MSTPERASPFPRDSEWAEISGHDPSLPKERQTIQVIMHVPALLQAPERILGITPEQMPGWEGWENTRRTWSGRVRKWGDIDNENRRPKGGGNG